jgi:hypothetical protein
MLRKSKNLIMLEALEKREKSFQSQQFRVETIKARPKLIKNAKVKDVFTPQKNTRSRNQHKRRMLLQSEGSYGPRTCEPDQKNLLRKSLETQDLPQTTL